MSETIIIKGEIETILETETFASGFTKRVLVVNDGGNKDGLYKQLIPIEFIKDQGKQLDSLQVGQAVSVSVNIRGSEYNGKYYANIQGWRIESEAAPAPTSPPAPVTGGIDADIDADSSIPF